MNRLTLTGQLLALAAGGVLLLGCGGNVQISSSGGGGAGGGGASGGGGAGGVTMTTTSTGGNTGGGGTGGAPVCDPPSSGFDMTLTAPDGSVWGCSLFDGTATGNLVFNAAVVKASGNALTLDACSPAADCLPILYELTLKAPGLNAYIDPGAYVHVQIEVAIPWGCYQRIQITNLPSWDGDPNPANPTKQLWLSAADGTLEVFNDSPFTIGKQILDCPGFQEGCGGDLPGQYDLRFSPGGDPSQTVIVPTGQSKMMSLLEGPTVLATNLRSFESGFCDDYWNWAYLVTPAPIK